MSDLGQPRYPLIIPAAAAPSPGKPDIARELTDIFSNSVFSFSSVWTLIETVKHPEIKGYENMVYDAIENPDLVMEGTTDEFRAIFERIGTGPYGRNLRVVVNYDAVGYVQGNTRGQLVTGMKSGIRPRMLAR